MIRRATIDDLTELGEIYVEIQTLHASLYPDFFRPADIVALTNHMTDLVQNEDYRIIVEEIEGSIAGYAVSKIIENSTSAIMLPFRMIILDQIVVRNEKQGKGFGKSLLKGIIEIAKEEKVDRIILDVWTKNESAREFYRSNGFTQLQEWMLYTG